MFGENVFENLSRNRNFDYNVTQISSALHEYDIAFLVARDIRMAFCSNEMVIRLLELQSGINNRRTRHGVAFILHCPSRFFLRPYKCYCLIFIRYGKKIR